MLSCAHMIDILYAHSGGHLLKNVIDKAMDRHIVHYKFVVETYIVDN